MSTYIERGGDDCKYTIDDNDGFGIGDKVKKVGGDYTFEGTVQSRFNKRSGARRYVVEDDRGILHIYSDKNLVLNTDSKDKIEAVDLSISIPKIDSSELIRVYKDVPLTKIVDNC